MAVSLTITISSNAQATRIVNAIAEKYGYPAPIDGVTASTKQEFARLWLIHTIKEQVKSQEIPPAVQSAEATVITDVDNIVIT